MGLLGLVVDGVKGLGSVVSKVGKVAGNAITKICNVVGTGLSKLGDMIPVAVKALAKICPKGGKFLTNITNLLEKTLSPTFGPLSPIIANIIVDVATQVLVSILTPVGEQEMSIEEAEEYGALIEESQNHSNWSSTTEFESARAYYEYLKAKADEDGVVIIPAAKLSVESIKRRTVAMGDLWDRVENKEEIKLTPEFLAFAGLRLFTSDQMKALILASKELGFDTVKFMELKDNKLTKEESVKFNESIVTALQNIKASKGENLSEDDAYTILVDMKKTLHNEKLVDSLKNQLESYADLGDKLFNEKQLDDELKDNH